MTSFIKIRFKVIKLYKNMLISLVSNIYSTVYFLTYKLYFFLIKEDLRNP